MKKLAGLFAFAFALACAILLTKHYSPQPAPPPPPPARAPAATPAPAGGPVVFKTQLVTLDPAAKRAAVTVALERGPSGAQPPSVWVWAYFFTQESPGRYCESQPVEVKRPFDSGEHVTVELNVPNCPAPRTASTTYYSRVNVSAESAFAARLPEQRIGYDISQASPVLLQGARK